MPEISPANTKQNQQPEESNTTPPNRRKLFTILAIAGGIVLLFVVVFAVHQMTRKTGKSDNNQSQSSQNSGGGSGPKYAALATCGNTPPLNTVPTNLADFNKIVPLGNVGVPDHTIPTDHLYFAFQTDGGSSQLKSPGNIVVTQIMNSGETHTAGGTAPNTNDYAITFFACKGARFIFGHVETLAPGPLADAVKDQKWDQPCQRNTPAPGEETFYCTKSTDIVLTPGQMIGSVGGKVGLGAFDFGAHKDGYKDPGFIRPERYSSIDAVCPLDYFDATSKAAMLAKLPASSKPQCGTIGQDVKDTLQGGWFSTQDLKTGISDWSTNLSFVHDNVDASIGIAAVAGKISPPQAIHFKPVHTGTVNREPSEIKPGTATYCFSDDATGYAHTSGKLIVKLTDSSSLKIEYKPGSCTGNEVLTEPTTYYR